MEIGRCGIEAFLLIFLIKELIACDGHDITLRGIKNCDDNNQIIKISENSSTTVNEKCEVYSNTCADVKAYSRASALVTMKRNNMVIFNRTENMCQNQKSRNELAKVMMSVCGLRCSMKEGSFCDNGSKVVTFSSTRKLFGIVRGDSLKIRIEVKHDTGTSCFESVLNIQQRH